MSSLEILNSREISPSPLGFSFGVSRPGEIITNEEALKKWPFITRSGKSFSQPEEISHLLGGIQQREVREGEYSATLLTMAYEAAREALSSFSQKEITAIFATTTFPALFDPELPLKNNLALALRKKLGLSRKVSCQDIYAACSGGVFLLQKIHQQEKRLQGKRILIVGAERYSGFLEDPFDKVIFTDKAVALVSSSYGEGWQILHSLTHSDYGDPKGVLRFPLDPRFSGFYQFSLPKSLDGKFKMDGHTVQGFTIRESKKLLEEILTKSALDLEDIKLIILHQANGKTIQAAQKRFGEERVYAHYQEGNASAASVFLALKAAMEEGKIQESDKVIMAAFGGGLSSGVCLLEIGKSA